MYLHCGTIFNSKDLQPTQMPIDNRLDKKNVAHIHHGISAALKNDHFVFFVGAWMNLETIILSKLTQEQKNTHVLTHRWVLINETTWTQGGEHHTGVCQEEIGEGQQGMGCWGEIAWGEMPDIGDGEEGSTSHCHVCTYARILHGLHMYPKT